MKAHRLPLNVRKALKNHPEVKEVVIITVRGYTPEIYLIGSDAVVVYHRMIMRGKILEGLFKNVKYTVYKRA